MQPSTLRVFVSSTWKDLEPERKKVETALQRMQETKFIGMEYFGSRDEDTQRTSLDEVDHCQIYIGIFGKRYGSGITEDEYRRARELGLECFIYFKDESTIKTEKCETDPGNIAKLEDLKKELRSLTNGHTVGPAFKNPDDLAAKITADLHRWIMELFVYGISSLTTDYAVRIQNFLTEYLGTPEQPVPFGGREPDLTDLDTWLNDPKAPPYLLLAAPAGRGKSALLVNWSQQLLTRKDLAVVFIPASIRFRTNLASVVFAASVARLAALHGDNPPDPNASAEVLRGMMADYLSRPLPDRRQLLIILDGVDEAADWDAGPYLFSLAPPERLRVIVSARYLAGDTDASSWLRRLGWDRPGLAHAPELSPLTQEGVADVLRKMGVLLDKLSGQVDIVAELHRLSEGDPLLVRLYVNDLWNIRETAARLQPEDLKDLSPGLEGYFDRWWDEQRQLWGRDAPLREPGVQELLNLFACSLGPLSRDDILDLASPDIKLNTWTLEDALRPLARFVIGDGNHQGYAFGHPRLGAYFYDKLSEGERQSTGSRFLAWGEGTLKALNEGKLLPDRASPYIVQYYGAHLQRAGSDAEALLSLVSEDWLRAWEMLEGAFSGFLNDVDRAWNAAEKADKELIDAGGKAAYLGDTIRCALCFASVSSLSKNIIRSDLFGLLMEMGIWTSTQGLVCARQTPCMMLRVDALSKLASQLQNPEEKSQVLDEALIAARNVKDEYRHASTLISLSSKFEDFEGECPILEEVLEYVQNIKNARLRASKLVEIATQLPDSQKKNNVLNEALDAARYINDDYKQAEILAVLASQFQDKDAQKNQVLDEAARAAYNIKNLYFRALGLAGLVPQLQNTKRTHILSEIDTVVRDLENEEERADISMKLASQLGDIEKKRQILDDALKDTRNIKNEFSRINKLIKLSLQYDDPTKKCEVRDEALKNTRNFGNETVRAEWLIELAFQFEDAEKKKQLLDDAIECINNIKDLELHDSKLQLMTKLASQIQDLGEKKRILNETLKNAQDINDGDYRAATQIDLMSQLASQLHDPQEKIRILDNAVEVAQNIRNEDSRASKLIDLASQFQDTQKKEQILNKASEDTQNIKDNMLRIRLMTKLSVQFQNMQKKEQILKEVLRAVEDISVEDFQTSRLIECVSQLEDPQKKSEVIDKSLKIIRNIKDIDLRASKLTELASLIEDPQKRGLVLDEALTDAQDIENVVGRVTTLVKLSIQFKDTQKKTNLLNKAVEDVQSIGDEDLRAFILADLTSQLQDPQKGWILDEVLEIVEKSKLGHMSAETLTILVPQIKDLPKRRTILLGVLSEVTEIEHGYFRASLLRRVAPYLAEFPQMELYPIWSRLLHILARDKRHDLLSELQALIPVIVALGGLEEALEETAHAIEDVGNWWP